MRPAHDGEPSHTVERYVGAPLFSRAVVIFNGLGTAKMRIRESNIRDGSRLKTTSWPLRIPDRRPIVIRNFGHPHAPKVESFLSIREHLVHFYHRTAEQDFCNLRSQLGLSYLWAIKDFLFDDCFVSPGSLLGAKNIILAWIEKSEPIWDLRGVMVQEAFGSYAAGMLGPPLKPKS